jgi:TetR/AcrR family transcriptional repressor of nem operon
MTTRDHIIQTADQLIRAKGYNAFSFVDIANVVGIRKPSIHHHFPRKTDLGVAVIEYHIQQLQKIQKAFAVKCAVEKLDRFFLIYDDIKKHNKVCLVGSLTTDYNTLDVEVQDKLRYFSEVMLNWVTDFLEEGRCKKEFHFSEAPRTKALLIITNMIAIVQLSRVTEDKDFNLMKETIKKELLTN